MRPLREQFGSVRDRFRFEAAGVLSSPDPTVQNYTPIYESRGHFLKFSCGLTRARRLCETCAHGIQRKSGVCPRAEDAGAEYAPLPAGALAYMDLGVFSGARATDIHALCAWVQLGQLGVAGIGAGGDGRGRPARTAAGRRADR